MPLTINHNLMASNASRNLSTHYSSLSTSVRRLSSGLRVGNAADDAAGLAIRELMRAEITSLNQGVRNANDAISLIQTADGALQIIDEKLIRMKELAEQAATGTYNSDQRLMIDSEFQAMAAEIQRIATATDFNGVKLLDGSLSGEHDGSGLQSTGELKVHFGSGNDSAEDYYYISGGDATLTGLGLNGSSNYNAIFENVPILSDRVQNGVNYSGRSNLISFAVIPKGSTNIAIELNDNAQNDSIQIFTRTGKHIAGTTIGQNSDTSRPGYIGTVPDWGYGGGIGSDPINIHNVADMNQKAITEVNGFLSTAYYDDTYLNGGSGEVGYIYSSPRNIFTYNGMNIEYSGDGNIEDKHIEYLNIDVVTEDLVFLVVGQGNFRMTASWGNMPPLDPSSYSSEFTGAISIQTQELAQKALERIDDAIIAKDNIRAHLGATQNRLENTISNLQIQAENMQAAESRISDVDVATEMTEFVRTQILVQSSVAMLAQANSLPNIIAKLFG